MELPIDHFRLLGVNPAIEAEAVLRALQLRLDRAPDQGFTNEVLAQRAELLRLSADLLLDSKLRQEYETALLGGASGLELSSSREVAGLILLWEADASYEAFNLAKKSLQPPQAPALGSGREADLTLVAVLSCRDAARQEQEERHYESSALLLQQGIQLLQRIGKLPDERKVLEKELESLLPYRILDLLSRDLGEQESHQNGIELLDGLVRERGGLEGRNRSKMIGGLSQADFELFFQQIRKFLTVQEQLDLFFTWQKRGSLDAGFLGAIALVAAGFSQRKPEKLHQARKQLKKIDIPGLDPMPLLGCVDLLLADIKQAEERFGKSSDHELSDWLENYPGEILEALCDYSRDWLRRDVLPGYRDVDSNAIDLEAWFADRDVQSYLEDLDDKGAFGLSKSSFSFLSSNSSEKKEESNISQEKSDFESTEIDTEKDGDLLEDCSEEKTDPIEKGSSQLLQNNLAISWLVDLKGRAINWSVQIIPSLRKVAPHSKVFAGLVVLISGISISYFHLRNRPSLELVSTQKEISKALTPEPSQDLKLIDSAQEEISSGIKSAEEALPIEPLTVDNPSKKQVQALLEAWLKGKASVLSGGDSADLPIVARPSLLKRIQLDRDKDRQNKEKQLIEASITSLKLVDKTAKRIEAKVKLTYKDQRINADGEIVSETLIPSLKVTYILGREKELWQLVAFISGD